MTTTTKSKLHISEMTVADMEEFERAHHILPDWGEISNRRRRRAEIDAAAMAKRAENKTQKESTT